jgi:hypothetical protein
VGELLPQGWLKNQLTLQAEGLAGHLAYFYPYVANSTWIGGPTQDPGGLNERGKESHMKYSKSNSNM